MKPFEKKANALAVAPNAKENPHILGKNTHTLSHSHIHTHANALAVAPNAKENPHILHPLSLTHTKRSVCRAQCEEEPSHYGERTQTYTHTPHPLSSLAFTSQRFCHSSLYVVCAQPVRTGRSLSCGSMLSMQHSQRCVSVSVSEREGKRGGYHVARGYQCSVWCVRETLRVCERERRELSRGSTLSMRRPQR